MADHGLIDSQPVCSEVKSNVRYLSLKLWRHDEIFPTSGLLHQLPAPPPAFNRAGAQISVANRMERTLVAILRTTETCFLHLLIHLHAFLLDRMMSP